MTTPTLYRIVDEYPYLEREYEYTGLTLEEAAIRMDDLTGCGEDVILSDWDEPCAACAGKGIYRWRVLDYYLRHAHYMKSCTACDGSGKWPGPWEFTDDETGREVTMMREAS